MCVCFGTAAEKAEGEADPEDEEYEMMNMPSLRSVMNGSFVFFVCFYCMDLICSETL